MTVVPPSLLPAVVLIANDQEWSARSLDSVLAPHGFTVIRAYTGQQARERALTAQPDLIILDAQLPDIHGMEVCRQLRADPRVGPTTPIVITTAGPSGRPQRLEAYAAGAWEFLGQPLDGEALLARIGTFLSIKRTADQLREAALIDTTSGLYTLHGLMRRMGEIGSDAFRHGRPLACIAVGTNGASEDANVAPRLGKVLKAFGRTADAIAHIGGGEYLLVAADTPGSRVPGMMERLETAMNKELVPGQPRTLLAGYSAVDDVRAAEVEPAALLDRATTALRYLVGHMDQGPVLAFERLPVPVTT